MNIFTYKDKKIKKQKVESIIQKRRWKLIPDRSVLMVLIHDIKRRPQVLMTIKCLITLSTNDL